MTNSACLATETPTRTTVKYVAIPIATLVPSQCWNLDLYQRCGEGEEFLLYRGRDIPITHEDLQKLRERDVTKLYILAEDQLSYQNYVRENLGGVLDNELIPPLERLVVLNQVTQDSLRKTFDQGEMGKTVEASQEMGRYTAEFLSRTDMVAQDVFSMLKHDFHTFTHSANVCNYSVLLAKSLGMSDLAKLEEIATGALLHDVGKIGIPWEILTKTDHLSEEERALIQSHPTAGFRKLCRRKELSWGQLMMVYQHHERLDGQGYPVRISGDEIHPWGRLCAIVDVFDALTSDRPYHRGRHITDVLEYLERESGRGFDSGMVKCWNSIMSKSC